MMTGMGVAKRRLLPETFFPGAVKVKPFHLSQGLCMPTHRCPKNPLVLGKTLVSSRPGASYLPSIEMLPDRLQAPAKGS